MGISLTIMGQRSIYNSTHTPQRSLYETLGFDHGEHLHRMCNETGIPEFLEFQITGIHMVVIVTSRVRSLRDPTQQDFITLTEVWHMAHFWVSYGRCTMPGSPMGRSEGLSRGWAGQVLPARNTKKNVPLHASRALMVVVPWLDHP